MKSKKQNKLIIFGVSLAVASIFFFFSFSGFSTILATQDIIKQDKIFISTDQTAVDGFVESLQAEIDKAEQSKITDIPKKDQALGVILSVVMKDSNGIIIPQEQNFLVIPSLGSLISVPSGELLDFAVLQFDFDAVLVKDDKIGAITIDYEMYMNRSETPFLSGTAFGTGTTTNNKLSLNFEQGNKKGDAIELDIGKGEIPITTVYGNDYRNTLDVKVTKVSATVGKDFDTKQYEWSGSFPVYTLKFDASPFHTTVRDTHGIAIKVLN